MSATNGNGNGNGNVSLATRALNVLEKQGLATVIVLVGMWWLSVKVADPLINSHVTGFAVLTENNKKLTEAVKVLSDKMTIMEVSVAAIAGKADQQHAEVIREIIKSKDNP